MAPTDEQKISVIQSTNVPEFSPASETWAVWLEKLHIHFTEIGCEAENTKKAILLKSVGADAYTLLHNICSPNSPVSKTYKEICTILETHFTPPTIVFHERKLFIHTSMHSTETVSQWYARVKKQALNCKLGDHLEEFIKTQFIVGLPDKIYERLCEEDETITMDQALRKALIAETKIAAKASEVNYVKRKNGNAHGNKANGSKTNKSNSYKRGNNNNRPGSNDEQIR